MLRASAGFFFFVVFFCLYAKLGGENDELIVLTGFCCLHAAVCSGPESCLRCTKRLQTCVVGVLFFSCCWLFMLEYVLRAALQAFFSPSSFGVGPWFVSACCALACSSPLSGCSVSAQRDFNNKINLQYAETRQTPTLLPLLLLRSSCLLQDCFYALTSDSKAACFFYFLFFPLIFLWPCKKVLEAF